MFPVDDSYITGANVWLGGVRNAFTDADKIKATRMTEDVWRAFDWKDDMSPFESESVAMKLRGTLLLHTRFILLSTEDDRSVFPDFLSVLKPYLKEGQALALPKTITNTRVTGTYKNYV